MLNKILYLKKLLKENKMPLYVRFRTQTNFITGLLNEIKREPGGILRCAFFKNGAIEIVNIHENNLTNVVIFSDVNFNPVFLKDFDAENKLSQLFEH